MKNTKTAAASPAAKSRARAQAGAVAETALEGRISGGSSVTFYSSSEARKHWSRITKQALNGENVAIIVGTRAVALKEVSLTYAEREYGVNEAQIHAKSEKIEAKAIAEIDSGRTRKIM